MVNNSIDFKTLNSKKQHKKITKKLKTTLQERFNSKKKNQQTIELWQTLLKTKKIIYFIALEIKF